MQGKNIYSLQLHRTSMENVKYTVINLNNFYKRLRDCNFDCFGSSSCNNCCKIYETAEDSPLPRDSRYLLTSVLLLIVVHPVQRFLFSPE